MSVLNCLKYILIIVIIILAILNFKNTMYMSNRIVKQQYTINWLEFEKEYLDFVYEDNIKQ